MYVLFMLAYNEDFVYIHQKGSGIHKLSFSWSIFAQDTLHFRGF